MTKSKCNFCRYWSGSGCMTVPNSKYCREALDEYKQVKQPKPIKSLRKWDRNK